MPFTFPEALADFPEAMDLINEISAAVDALPKAPAPISVKAYADLMAAVLPRLGALIDKVREQVAS